MLGPAVVRLFRVSSNKEGNVVFMRETNGNRLFPSLVSESSLQLIVQVHLNERICTPDDIINGHPTCGVAVADARLYSILLNNYVRSCSPSPEDLIHASFECGIPEDFLPRRIMSNKVLLN